MRIVALLFVLLPAFASAQAPESTPVDEARYQHLLSELRCLVCQNQSIAESNAPLADDLRRQVRELMNAGRSDKEIQHYLTDRYGDFVLYRPPLKSTTVALWAGPFVLLLIGLVVALLVYRCSAGPADGAMPDADAVRRVLEEDDK